METNTKPSQTKVTRADAALLARLETEAPDLLVQSEALNFLEARCPAPLEKTKAAKYRLPLTLVATLIGAGAFIASLETLSGLSITTAVGLGAALAFGAARSASGLRTIFRTSGLGRKHAFWDALTGSAQAIGVVLALNMFTGGEPRATVVAVTGSLLAWVGGWLGGADDSRTRRLREEISDAREDLENARASFAGSLEKAHRRFERDMTRLKTSAGIETADPAVPAE